MYARLVHFYNVFDFLDIDIIYISNFFYLLDTFASLAELDMTDVSIVMRCRRVEIHSTDEIP